MKVNELITSNTDRDTKWIINDCYYRQKSEIPQSVMNLNVIQWRIGYKYKPEYNSIEQAICITAIIR